MSDFQNAMAVAASAMNAQATRLRISSENIANVDTPGFHRKLTTFEQAFDSSAGVSLVKTGRVTLDQSELKKVYDPQHPMADAAGYLDGSNVNMVVEIADAREAQRSYEANLKMFDQARKMASSVLDLLRR